MLTSTDPWVGSDAFTRANVVAHEYTLHEWFPVADTTARAQYVTDLGTAGITISSSNPARVFRADAGTGVEHEVSIDGTNWESVVSHVHLPGLMTWSTAAVIGTSGSVVDCGTALVSVSDQTTSGSSFASVSGVTVTVGVTGLYVVGVGGNIATTETARYFVQGTLTGAALGYGELRVRLTDEGNRAVSHPMRLDSGDTIKAQAYAAATGKTLRCSISLMLVRAL